MPKLELRQTTDERAKLLILLGWERRRSAGLHLVFRLRRIEFRRQESEEEIKEVDAKGIGDCLASARPRLACAEMKEMEEEYTDVPSLGHHDAHHEQQQEGSRGSPSVRCVWYRLVEISLVCL